jgi:hypothetical protein
VTRNKQIERIQHERKNIDMKENDGRRREKKNPSAEFIDQICSLYDDIYDDREEDSSIGGEDWAPGQEGSSHLPCCFPERTGRRVWHKTLHSKDPEDPDHRRMLDYGTEQGGLRSYMRSMDRWLRLPRCSVCQKRL